MPTFTATQIGMAAWNAGFHDEPTLARAVAVALAESGGRTDALGDTKITDKTWGPSVGLWQIRSVKSETGKGTSRDVNKLKDPQFNANAAWEISNHGKNWGPWTAFTHNTYMQYIDTGKAVAADLNKRARAASANPLNWIFPGIGNVANTVGGIGESISGVAGSLGNIPGAIQNAANSALQTFQKISLAVGAVIVAVVLIVLAVVIMLRKPLKDSAKTVSKVLP